MNSLKMFLGLLICGVLAFGASKSFASAEEMQILVNTLVEKGQLTADEGKELMKAVENSIKTERRKTEGRSVEKHGENCWPPRTSPVAGYVQGLYSQYGNNKPSNGSQFNQFSIGRAVIGIKGNVTDDVLYKLEVQVDQEEDGTAKTI